jgi:hypothetical protein
MGKKQKKELKTNEGKNGARIFYKLFNDALSTAQYIKLNGKMIDERLIGKDLEGMWPNR